jgi:ATPase subunit of ABC transporter with duplicated ATPase domains
LVNPPCRTLVRDLTPIPEQLNGQKMLIGYFAQDHAEDFAENISLIEWMGQWRKETDDDQTIRGTLGRLLFSNDEIYKSVKVISGGEQGRMLFGKLILQKNNIMVMDEPTNHSDGIVESPIPLGKLSRHLDIRRHDREFVSSL